MTTYDLLIHVPIVDVPRPDGVRAVDPAFQRAIEERLSTELAARGFSAHELLADQREGWLDEVEALVLARLRPPQMRLL